jgi:hypothetical protein
MKGTGFSTVVMLCTAFTVNAGGLSNGTWSASACGARPEPPAVDPTSISTYNQSVSQVNDWQKQMQTYHECVIREANADIAAINQAAAAEQASINQASGNVNADLNRGRDRLQSMPGPSGPPVGPGMPGYQ